MTRSKDIYVYWGLHFTALSRAYSPEQSKREVRMELMRAVEAWLRKVESTKSSEVRRNSVKVLKSILRELRVSFSPNDVRQLEVEVKQ